MKKYLYTLLLLFCCSPALAAERFVYEGPWYTTKNRKLEGIMTAEVDYVAKGQWKGRFFGTWHGVKFSYDVKWEGKPDKLKGKAKIDGADYTWTGKITPMSPGKFDGDFTGSRYTGYFRLKQKTKK